MLFRDRQSMQRGLCHIVKISRRLLQDEDLVRGAATWTKTALSVLLFRFYYFTALPFKAYTFPGKLSSYIPLFVKFIHCLDHLSWILEWSCLSAVLLVRFQTTTEIDTLELPKEFLRCSKLSTSLDWFHLYQQLSRILTGQSSLHLHLLWRLPLPRNISVHVCHHR